MFYPKAAGLNLSSKFFWHFNTEGFAFLKVAGAKNCCSELSLLQNSSK
jgi:hypothetical protein